MIQQVYGIIFCVIFVIEAEVECVDGQNGISTFASMIDFFIEKLTTHIHIHSVTLISYHTRSTITTKNTKRKSNNETMEG
jgi:hypothetical protein